MADACDHADWLDDVPFDAELPIFHLRRERIPLPAKLKLEGYQRVVTIREVRFRFTAVSFRQSTSHVCFFEREVEGHWTQERVHTPDTVLVIELMRQFAGFIYAVIEAEPAAPMLEFRSGVDDRSLRNFCRTATKYLARRLNATYTMKRCRSDIAYVLTLLT